MTTINLKEFFYWYKADVFIEVTEEVAEELRADKRYEPTHQRRMKRNKANYSLDAEDGSENAACEFEPTKVWSLWISTGACAVRSIICRKPKGGGSKLFTFWA